MNKWPEEEISSMLDIAENNIRNCVINMKLKNIKIIRKSRAVGLVSINEGKLEREQLVNY